MEPVIVEVRIPLSLRRLTGGESTVEAAGSTLGEVIDDLERRYSGFRARLLDEEGKLHQYMNIYRNGDDVRYQANLETRLSAGDRVQIVPAAAGGR